MWQRLTKILVAKKKKTERQECLSNCFFNIDYISATISQPKKKKKILFNISAYALFKQ